jgi:hypothetical protein
MPSPTSRYANSQMTTVVRADGKTVSCLALRMLPLPSAMLSVSTVTVPSGERLDATANRVFGDPLQYYRLCDANGAMNPFLLVDDMGPVLRVPSAQSGGT